MSDILDNSYQYNLIRDIQIQTVRILQGPNKSIVIEIVTEDGSSTPTIIEHRGFTQREIATLMGRITAAL